MREKTERGTRQWLQRTLQILFLCCLIPLLPAAPHRDLAVEMVQLHNRVRAQVRVPPLVWSDKLAAHAKQWAEHLADRDAFEHSRNPNYGENLYEISGTPGAASATPEQVIDAWASEARNYDYRSNRCRGVCGHYTQLVWRDTKEVGCGVASRRGREVWVCNYGPPGNYVGERPW